MAMASSWWPCAGIWKWRCIRRRTNSTTAKTYGYFAGVAQRVTDGQEQVWQTEAEGLPGGGAEDGVEGSTQVVFLC